MEAKAGSDGTGTVDISIDNFPAIIQQSTLRLLSDFLYLTSRGEVFHVPKAGQAFSTGEGSNRLLSGVEFPQVLASVIFVAKT